MIYFDSRYLAKLYLMESDSTRVRARAEASEGLACCAVGRGEVVATFHRHFREKRLTQREFRQLAAQVEADLDAGLWTALPVTSSLVEAQARRMATLPANVSCEPPTRCTWRAPSKPACTRCTAAIGTSSPLRRTSGCVR